MNNSPALVVASDLDGTLLTSDRLVTPRTRRIVERLRKAGGVFVAVTARPLRDAVQIAHDVGADGLVCSGGGVVFDPGAKMVIKATTFSTPEAMGVAAALRVEFPDLRIGIDYLDRCELDLGFDLGWAGATDVTRSSGLKVTGEPVVKLIIQSESLGTEHLAERASALLSARGEQVTVAVSCSRFAEILPAGVDKAGYLDRLCAGLARAVPTVAFGDMPSDLPVLRWADMAVAVANAHPAALAVVDEVTGANDDEGVAAFLERILDENTVTPDLHRRTSWSLSRCPRARWKYPRSTCSNPLA